MGPHLSRGAGMKQSPKQLSPRCSPRPQSHHQVPWRAPGVPEPKPSGARRMDRLRCRPWAQFGLCPLARDDSKALWDLGKGHGKAQRPRRVRPPCLSAEGGCIPPARFWEAQSARREVAVWKWGMEAAPGAQGAPTNPSRTTVGAPTSPHTGMGSGPRRGRGNTSLLRSH